MIKQQVIVYGTTQDSVHDHNDDNNFETEAKRSFDLRKMTEEVQNIARQRIKKKRNELHLSFSNRSLERSLDQNFVIIEFEGIASIMLVPS
jgi:hypothetical protein